MQIDERGSEVLELPECRRLLAVGAKEHLHGHLGVSGDGAPTVLPVNYTMRDMDVVLVVGEGLFHRIVDRLVAFQVDGTVGPAHFAGTDESTPWSVLVQGLAMEEPKSGQAAELPTLEVAEPGHRVVRIRTDVLTGRKLGVHRERHPSTPAPGALYLVPKGSE